jgi:hypothetical protein
MRGRNEQLLMLSVTVHASTNVVMDNTMLVSKFTDTNRAPSNTATLLQAVPIKLVFIKALNILILSVGLK